MDASQVKVEEQMTFADQGLSASSLNTPNPEMSEKADMATLIQQSVKVESACQPLPSSESMASMYQSMQPALPPNTTREALHQSAQQIIEDINAKRKQDTQLMTDYKKALDLQVQKACENVEQYMFQVYEREGTTIQEKIQELFATLDRIAGIEAELQEFKQALQILYQDMHQAE